MNPISLAQVLLLAFCEIRIVHPIDEVIQVALVSGDDVASPGGDDPDKVQVIGRSDHHAEIGLFPLNATSPLRCGQVLNESSGLILYKAFEKVMDNERCVWTVVTTDASGYKVNVQYLGKNSNPKVDRLVISGFSRGINHSDTIVPKKVGEYNISSVNILIIVFKTGDIPEGTNETGFALQYQVIPVPPGMHVQMHGVHPQFSRSSKHYILPSPIFDLQHPVQGHYKTQYTSNELSTFIFVPRGNRFSEEHKDTLIYKKDSLELLTCADHLNVYFFNANRNCWDRMGRICGDTNLTLIRNNDITLITFESDASSEGNGFQFIYM